MSITRPQAGDALAGLHGYRIDRGIEEKVGFATVFTGVQARTEGDVLVTVVTDPAHVVRLRARRFQRDSRLQAQFAHPVLAPELESGRLGNAAYVVVARPAGRSLSDLLSDGPLEPARALAILAPVAELLEDLHRHGLTAGDLHPSNIFVDHADRPCVTQLGLMDVPALRTSAAAEVGLLAYASNEALMGQPIDARSDTYSFATILFRALTGDLPFSVSPVRGKTAARAVLISRRVPPMLVTSALPDRVRRRLTAQARRELDAIFRRALSHQRTHRRDTPSIIVGRAQAVLLNTASGRPRAFSVAEPEPSRPGRAPRKGSTATPGPAAADRSREPRISALSASEPMSSAPFAPERTASLAGVPVAHPAPQRDSPHASAIAPRAVDSSARRGVFQGSRSGTPVFAALLGLFAVATFALGWALAHRDTAETPLAAAAPDTRVVRADAYRLSFPSSWRRFDAAAGATPGLPLRDAVHLRPRATGNAALASARASAGMIVAPTTRRLMTPALERRLSSVPEPETVRLGRYEAYRYRNLRVRGAELPISLFLMPTSRGVATISCQAHAAMTWLADECEAIATTLVPTGAQPLGLGPDRAYAKQLNGVLASLDAGRRSQRARLRSVRSGRAQSRRAAALAGLFSRASDRLARQVPPPPEAVDHRELTRAVRATGNAYESLSAAAGRFDRRAYTRAARLVRGREAQLQTRLQGLAEGGYRIR